MTLGDRVAVLKDGLLQQVAPPAEVYRRPANVFVAGFIGSPAMNFFEGRLTDEGGARRFEFAAFNVDLGGLDIDTRSDQVVLGVRPQDIEIVAAAEADVQAVVDVVELLGSELLLHMRLAGTDDLVVRAIVSEAVSVSEDETVGLRFRRDRLHLFSAVGDAGSEQREGGERLN